MVSWSADGTMAAYDPVTKRLKKGLIHFATPGSVDVKAITRLNYPLGTRLNKTTFPNNLQLTAPIAFTAGDFAANPGKKFSVAMMMIRAERFPPNHVPTPTEMFKSAAYDWAQRSNDYVFGGAITHTFEINPSMDAMGGLFWNTKWWVLLMPTAITDVNAQWKPTADKVPVGMNLNTVGRVVSFWSNRTPGKPTITSPLDGALVLPGAEFTLRLNPNDPDEMAPEDAAKYNDDVNGVHFQYRAAPTPDNTNPDWNDLPFDWEYTYTPGPFQIKRRDGAWNIRGSRNWNGLAGTPYHEALVANLGCIVRAGAGDAEADFVSGKGALPTGNWQIRGRTFDYGHPYPNSGTSLSEPGPLGIDPNVNFLLEPAKDTYPATNTSPWSDPVTVNIPAQVPPPVAISPKDSAAVPDFGPVRLKWQYRNTHVPARDQFLRTVQIRKVGDPNWVTVFDGIGSDNYVDLPWVLDQTSIAPMNLFTDPGFESGGLNGWGGASLTDTAANVNDPTKAHSGNRFLSMGTTALAGDTDALDSYVLKALDLPPDDYIKFDFDGWVWQPPGEQGFLLIQVYWYDGDGNLLTPPLDDQGVPDFEWPYSFTFFSQAPNPGDPDPGGWKKISEMTPYVYSDAFGTYNYGRLDITRHPEAASMIVSVDPGTNIFGSKMSNWRMDDISFTASGTALESFTIVSGNQYEWRVAVTDTDNIASGYSAPARFWAVPAGDSGEVLPVPSETVDGAALGCGKYRVLITRRGGVIPVGWLTGATHIDWGRMRDDISTANVVIANWDIDCGNLLSKLQTWAYELVLFRDNGYSIDRVWEGPITLLTYETDKVTIDAKDVMGYAYRRIIKQKMTDSGTGNGTTVVDRARRIIQNVFAPDDPNVLSYLQVLSRDDDAMQYRSTPAYSRTAYEEVDDMAANAGLDYTVVGRSILLWGTKHRIGTLPELRDKDLGASPIVSEYGMEFANVYSVSDGNGVHGEATRGLDPVTGVDPVYGLVELLSSTWASDSEEDSGTYTQSGLDTLTQSFKDFAERSIADSYPPPVVVRIPDNTSLNPDTVLWIQHLVPGVVIPLRSTSTLREVADSQKLDSVKVVVEKGSETISITLSPFSRDDATVVDGGDA